MNSSISKSDEIFILAKASNWGLLKEMCAPT